LNISASLASSYDYYNKLDTHYRLYFFVTILTEFMHWRICMVSASPRVNTDLVHKIFFNQRKKGVSFFLIKFKLDFFSQQIAQRSRNNRILWYTFSEISTETQNTLHLLYSRLRKPLNRFDLMFQWGYISVFYNVSKKFDTSF